MSAEFGPGHVVAGSYRIERLLEQGGMGSVYHAVQLSVGRAVALKLLVDEHVGSAGLLARFQREALALARLEHPNTVRLFDFGTSEEGCPFLVMELLRGADLARDLERQGPLRYDHALKVARQILCSLAEAHDAGIVHRDIKPANVFLCAGASWPLVKVLDFGIAGGIGAEPAAPRLTRTGTVVGSAAYMSPEQAQGHAVGAAADLYAVGVVLFEMLTQRTLFEPRVLTAQLLAKVMEPAPRLRDVCPGLDVPAELEALVAELVERDVAKRPASARGVIRRIDALLERAALPPLVRAVASAGGPPASGTLHGGAAPAGAAPVDGARGVPRTEPMSLPLTVAEGWAPRASSAPPAPVAPRPGRRVPGWSVAAALLVLGSGTLGALAGPPEAASVGRVFATAVAPLARLLSSAAPRQDASAPVVRAVGAAAGAAPGAAVPGLFGQSGVSAEGIDREGATASSEIARGVEGEGECLDCSSDAPSASAEGGGVSGSSQDGPNVAPAAARPSAGGLGHAGASSGAGAAGSARAKGRVASARARSSVGVREAVARPKARSGSAQAPPSDTVGRSPDAPRSSAAPDTASVNPGTAPELAAGAAPAAASSPGLPAAAEPAGAAGSVPGGSVPSGSVPAGSVPAGSVPAGSVPAGSVPAGSVPAGSVPAGAPERAGQGEPPIVVSPAPSAPFGGAPDGATRPDMIILPESTGADPNAGAASPGWPRVQPDLEHPRSPPVSVSPARPPLRERAQRERAGSGRGRPLPSIAAVEAAHAANEISWAERNELITALRQLQADARARVAQAYREGRISRRELRLRQRAIDRELGGELAAPPRRRPKILLHW